MARFEIVMHVTRELPCDTADEAAALVHRQTGSQETDAEQLLHLAVWRQPPAPAPSPLPEALREKLLDFFTSLEGCAAESEHAFRDEVAAILSARNREETNSTKRDKAT